METLKNILPPIASLPALNPGSGDGTTGNDPAQARQSTSGQGLGTRTNGTESAQVGQSASGQDSGTKTTKSGPTQPTKYPFIFSKLREGDQDPTLGKTVEILVDSDDDFIVYLDEDHYVEWNMNDNNLLGKGTGSYLNRVGQLEAIDTRHLHLSRKIPFKRMVAEGVARLFDKSQPEQNFTAAKEALDFAEQWITARNTELARSWYLLGSGVAALVAVGTALILGYQYDSLHALPYFKLMIGTAFGGIGAWLSVIQRSRTTGLDVAAGPVLHHIEGAFRIMAGSLGAMLIALAIHAGLFVQSNRLSVILVICMIAGVSERLVPSFIEQMETRTSGGPQESKTEKKP